MFAHYHNVNHTEPHSPAPLFPIPTLLLSTSSWFLFYSSYTTYRARLVPSRNVSFRRPAFISWTRSFTTLVLLFYAVKQKFTWPFGVNIKHHYISVLYTHIFYIFDVHSFVTFFVVEWIYQLILKARLRGYIPRGSRMPLRSFYRWYLGYFK